MKNEPDPAASRRVSGQVRYERCLPAAQQAGRLRRLLSFFGPSSPLQAAGYSGEHNKKILDLTPVAIGYWLLPLMLPVVFLLLTSNLAFPLDPLSLFKSAADVSNLSPFQGVQALSFYKEGKTHTEKLRLVFLSEKSFKGEILEPADLKGTVFGRSGDEFTFFVPSLHLKMSSPTGQQDKGVMASGGNLYLVSNWSLFIKNYSVSHVKDESFLGRKVLLLAISSKTGLSAKRKLWIDAERRLLLKEERYFSGKLYYAARFESISFDKPTPDQLELKGGKGLPLQGISRNIYPTLAKAKPHLPFSPFVPNFLPKGFSMKDVRLRKTPLGKDVVLVYTDGLHSIRVEERRSGLLGSGLGKLMKGLFDKFTVYSQTNTVKKDIQGIEVTIIGEAPETFLEKIMESLRPLK